MYIDESDRGEFDIREVVGSLVGSPVVATSPVSGGDINQAIRAQLADGRTVFAKSQSGQANDSNDTAGQFAIEADGLRRLAGAAAVRVPEVVAVSDDALVLEWIDVGRPAVDFDATFGRQLAHLHRMTSPRFGMEHGLEQLPPSLALAHDDTPCETWPEFYASRRLEPLIRHNLDNGRLPARSAADFARLIDRLPELCGPTEPPALLHGDLWGGNCISDDAGQPVLVDPHAHFGHREVDLAMMRLFGGFGSGVFAAYNDAFPLANGHAERVPLYQLHPLLNHVALFGTGYTSAVLTALGRYT
jgi:fructosamine-3-kinase